MPHNRLAIVALCLFALVWCQAAAHACDVTMPLAATAGNADDSHAGCHDGKSTSPSECCDELSASEQKAKTPADTAHAFPAVPQVEVAHSTGATLGLSNRALPPRMPPHFLGRLLI